MIAFPAVRVAVVQSHGRLLWQQAAKQPSCPPLRVLRPRLRLERRQL